MIQTQPISTNENDNTDVSKSSDTAGTLPSPTNTSDELIINLTNMTTGITQSIACSANLTIHQLKHKYYNNEIESNKLIRVIYLGKILSDNLTLLQCNIQPSHTLHIIVSDQPVEPTNNNINDSNTDNDNINVAYVHQYRVVNIDRDLYPAEYYDYNHHHTVLNENDQLVDPALHSIQYDGTTAEFVLGYLFGFILGPISMFWLFATRSSRRYRLGIVSGLLFNVLFSIIRFYMIQGDTNNNNNDSNHNDGSNTNPHTQHQPLYYMR